MNHKMLENELISIIIPIYNVENYLRQCLDSIMSQTHQNFECLLINDGSPDNSADICREYVEKDSRFKYFEKENGGVSSARNLGIECSRGEYITFIDSDDWVDSDYLEVLYNALIDENAFPSPTSMVLADNVMMEKERHIRVVNALRVVLLIFPMCRGE